MSHQALALEVGGLLQSSSELGNICLMVLVMMDLHCQCIDVRLESFWGKSQRREDVNLNLG